MRRRLFNRLGIKALGAVILSFFLSAMIIGRVFGMFAEWLLTHQEVYANPVVGILMFAGATSLFIVIFFVLVNARMGYFRYIIQSVKGIDSVEFIEELHEKGHDEFTELAKSINVMNRRIQEKFLREKEIEESKNELITMVSHDLKTPLTSLIGYMELLNLEKEEDERRNQYIEIAYQKSLRLNELINELFEYTRLSSSDIRVEKSRINLSNLVNQVVGESILDFDEKNIDVVLENPYKELYYDMDANLFTRVLENMVRNAYKYSDGDSVFKVIVEDEKEEIRISFINKCERIKQAELSKIFDKFYREDEARSSENEGTGLGLTIAKRIVELHDGTLTANKRKENVEFIVCLKKEKDWK